MVQRKSFADMECPIAQSLDEIGEWWSMLIMRDALDGFTRFDEFEHNLGIAPNMLARRLTSLVGAGLLDRRLYRDRPKRYEYIVTARGRELRPVIVALYAWGNRQLAEHDKTVVLVDGETGDEIDPVLVDRRTGRSLADSKATFVAGPAASDFVRRRLDPHARIERRRRAERGPEQTPDR